MTDSLRHVVHRRVHLERSQPKARQAKVGRFLEKKRDYKLRAERYHVMERRIHDLAAKARFRNEDEFNFKMVHGKLGDDGVVVLPSDAAASERKLDRKGQFKKTLAELDQNRFVLKHRLNVKSKRAKEVLTDNATLLMDSGSHITFDDSASSLEERASSDGYSSSNDESVPKGNSSGGTSRLAKQSKGLTADFSASASKAAPATNARKRTRATKSVQEYLSTVGETINSKRTDAQLQQRLEDERNLRSALYQKRQVRRLPNNSTRVFPFERQK